VHPSFPISKEGMKEKLKSTLRKPTRRWSQRGYRCDPNVTVIPFHFPPIPYADRKVVKVARMAVISKGGRI
jgi:hypothetical protein